MSKNVFAWSWHTTSLAVGIAGLGLAVSSPILLDGEVNRTGKAVGVGMLLVAVLSATAFASARVILTDEGVVSRYGLSRRTIPYREIVSATVGTGNQFTGAKCPWLELRDGTTVGLGQIGNGPRRKLADELVDCVTRALAERR